MIGKAALLAAIILIASGQGAHAGIGATSTSFPISASATLACANGGAGDTVIVSGTAHEVVRQQVDANGGAHFLVRLNYEGLRGTSASGSTYVGVAHEVFTSHNFDPFVGPPYNFTFNEQVSFIGQGNAPSFTSKTVNHVTVDASGDVTSTVILSSVTCR